MDVIGCTPIQLEDAHAAELRSLIERLKADATAGNESNNESNLERFEKLVLLYSDEPQLLDPIIPEMVQRLLTCVEFPCGRQDEPSSLTLAALNRLRLIIRTRGYKIVLRVLPHDVSYMERVLVFLEHYVSKIDESASRSTVKETDRRAVYVLVVWLLIICKNPFSLAKFNASSATQPSAPITKRLTNALDSIQRHYTPLGEMSSSVQRVVSTLLAQLLTRRDSDVGLTLRPTVANCMKVIIAFESEVDGGRELLTEIQLLHAMLKWGRRDQMLPIASAIFAELESNNLVDTGRSTTTSNTEVRNLMSKLLQRVAMTMLRPRLATWRYKCGVRNINEGLKKSVTEVSKLSNGADEVEDDGEIPFGSVEKIVGRLLEGVHDRDNVVRWTSAKGLARVAARLPLEMASEIVTALIDSSFQSEKEGIGGGSYWHGGCLALAELCRRGCLLPSQIPQLMPLLKDALLYEQSHVGFALSVAVRDAACYICWAFARAYPADVLRPHLKTLASTLACLALFDREVNVRRAASAAFQENVGRNGCFPEGIRVLLVIDYTEVARIRRCYLELAVQVARFKAYARPLIDHLYSVKCLHWDDQVRELASQSLRLLVPFDVDYVLKDALPCLIHKLERKDTEVEIRHGLMFAISGALMGLHEGSHLTESVRMELAPKLFAAIERNLYYIKDHRLKGFVLISRALCRLIEALSFLTTPLSDAQLTQFNDVLDTVIGDTNKQLYPYAVDAYRQLSRYYRTGDEARTQLLVEGRLCHKYFKAIDEAASGCGGGDEQQRCASIAPLAHLLGGGELLTRRLSGDGSSPPRRLVDAIVEKLLGVIDDPSTPKWVHARAAAIDALTSILLNASKAGECMAGVDWAAIVSRLTRCCDDHTVTTNGDVGRFARRAGVLALGKLLPLAAANRINPLRQDEISAAVGKMLQRACEYIDELRATAAETLAQLLENSAADFDVAERELLESIFVGVECEEWQHADGFLRLEPLLNSPTYRRYALEGFVLSAGSLSTWTSQSAFEALAHHLRPAKKSREALESFLNDVLAILAKAKDPTAVIRTCQMLLSDRIFSLLEREQPDESGPYSRLAEKFTEVALGKGRPKIKCLALTTLGCFLQSNPASQLYRRCLGVLISMLDSPYPVLRESAVEQLFEHLNMFSCLDESDSAGERNAKALALIAEVPWSAANEAEKITNAKQEIASLLLCTVICKEIESPNETSANNA